eukprot:gene32418-40012_t
MPMIVVVLPTEIVLLHIRKVAQNVILTKKAVDMVITKSQLIIIEVVQLETLTETLQAVASHVLIPLLIARNNRIAQTQLTVALSDMIEAAAPREGDYDSGKKMRFEEAGGAHVRPSSAVGPTVSTLLNKYSEHRDRDRDQRGDTKNNTKENNRNTSNNNVVSLDNNLTPSRDDSTAVNTSLNATSEVLYDESELKDIETFLEFGGVDEEDEQTKVERLQAERKKRLEDIANKYKKTGATTASDVSGVVPVATVVPPLPLAMVAPVGSVGVVGGLSVKSDLTVVSTTITAAGSEEPPLEILTSDASLVSSSRKLSLERNTIPMDISFSAQATPNEEAQQQHNKKLHTTLYDDVEVDG